MKGDVGVQSRVQWRRVNNGQRVTPRSQEGGQKGQLRVAAYCRVSTEMEAQEASFELQMQALEDTIRKSSDMVLAGVYGDKGVSGAHMEHRVGLQQMLADCEAGKIDLIITKSISRFARNLADCMETLQRLGRLGVVVLFQKENLRTDDANAEMLLQLLAAMAEGESRANSRRHKYVYAQSARQGITCGIALPYGYRLNRENHAWEIVEGEARRVRFAFASAARGMDYTTIRKGLDAMEQEEASGRTWSQHRLAYLLRNEAYMGDFLAHKYYSPSIRRSKPNRGEEDKVYVEEQHVPLVSREMFLWVQLLMERGMLRTGRIWTEKERQLMQQAAF